MREQREILFDVQTQEALRDELAKGLRALIWNDRPLDQWS